MSKPERRLTIIECPDCGKEICVEIAVIDDLILVQQELEHLT
jgi:hypothetical protein